MNIYMQLASLALLSLAVSSISVAEPAKDLRKISTMYRHERGMPMASEKSRSALGAQQLQALSKLDGESVEPVLVQVESTTGRVIRVEAKLKSGLTGKLHHRARQALGATIGVFNPEFDLGQLKVPTEEHSCEAAPSMVESEDEDGTVIFQHDLDGIPVLGSTVTVNLQNGGRQITIENNLQPFKLSGRRLPREMRRGTVKLSKLLPEKAVRASLDKTAMKVVYPTAFAGGKNALVKARMLTWGNDVEVPIQTAIIAGRDTVIDHWTFGVPNKTSSKVGVQAHIDKRTGLPDFLSYRSVGGLTVASSPNISSAELVYRYLETNRSVFRTGNPRCQFRYLSEQAHDSIPGTSYVRMGQVIAEREVFGAQLVFELSDNKIMSVQGHVLANAAMPLEPEISSQQASELAKSKLDVALANDDQKHIRGFSTTPRNTRLVIYPGELSSGNESTSRLAYLVEFEALNYFIDARNGELLSGYSNLHGDNVVNEALNRGVVLRPTYVAANIDGVPQPGVAANTDTAAAVSALAASAGFFAAHGWNGMNGEGSDIVVNTNVALEGGACPNAIYTPLIDETFYCLGMASGDVVGHEITHGVINHSSRLIYRDESGALNESYADIMGNLIVPDSVPPVPGAWLVGETTSIGAIRDMALPPVASYAGYLSRADLGCSPLDVAGIGCDSGGVHSNSGITNLAHVLLSDGAAAGGGAAVAAFPGIGRPKTRVFAFDVMANRLSPWSRLLDSALGTQASCELFMNGGGTDLTGAAIVQSDCDQVQFAFQSVGLDIDLVTDWSPPAVGFAGTIVQYLGETTDSACNIADVALQMNTPAGLFDSLASTSGGVPAVNYLGLMTATIPATTPPIGTPFKTHIINWTSAFGYRPSLSSSLTEVAPPAGATDCTGGPAQVERHSEVQQGNSFLGIVGFGTTATGDATSAMNGACTLNSVGIELLDDEGTVLASGTNSATYTELFLVVAGLPVNHSKSATIVTPGVSGAVVAGPPPTRNLAANVNWSVGTGFANVRWRLVYFVGQPAGVICAP